MIWLKVLILIIITILGKNNYIINIGIYISLVILVSIITSNIIEIDYISIMILIVLIGSLSLLFVFMIILYESKSPNYHSEYSRVEILSGRLRIWIKIIYIILNYIIVEITLDEENSFSSLRETKVLKDDWIFIFGIICYSIYNIWILLIILLLIICLIGILCLFY